MLDLFRNLNQPVDKMSRPFQILLAITSAMSAFYYYNLLPVSNRSGKTKKILESKYFWYFTLSAMLIQSFMTSLSKAYVGAALGITLSLAFIIYNEATLKEEEE